MAQLTPRFTTEELLAALATQGIAYKDLRTSESSLEDIFVSLVHDQKAEV